MKKLFAGFALAASAFAATWNGTLTDVMCKDKDVAAHTKKCALGCAKSGFGVWPIQSLMLNVPNSEK